MGHLEVATCCALTRSGTACRRKDLHVSGKCKLHGGASTGPKTEMGKAQASKNGKLGGRPPSRKPKSMKLPEEHEVLPTLPLSVLPTPHAARIEPDLGGLEYGRTGFTATHTPNAGHVQEKPNPMNGVLELPQAAVLIESLTDSQNPAKPKILNGEEGNPSAMVKCRDCSNLSAGFTCLAPDSGQVAPAMGDWRMCTHYRDLSY